MNTTSIATAATPGEVIIGGSVLRLPVLSTSVNTLESIEIWGGRWPPTPLMAAAVRLAGRREAKEGRFILAPVFSAGVYSCRVRVRTTH